MTHQEILNKTKSEIDSLCAQAKEKLDAISPIDAELGKWYKDPSSNYLVYVTKILGKHNYVEVYGFGSNGNWFNKWDTVVHQLCVEATSQEVEQALIEEAKRRGYKEGNYNCLTSETLSVDDSYFYDFETNRLCHGVRRCANCIFKAGQWATIIEQDKFAELKEAHRNGAVIQLKMDNRWFDCDPVWTPIFTYRIKPKEKPKVGDVCKFWNEYEDVFLVGIYAELRDRNDQWDDNNTHTHGVRLGANYYTKFFKHAKPLTQQETIDLLFNNK